MDCIRSLFSKSEEVRRPRFWVRVGPGFSFLICDFGVIVICIPIHDGSDVTHSGTMYAHRASSTRGPLGGGWKSNLSPRRIRLLSVLLIAAICVAATLFVFAVHMTSNFEGTTPTLHSRQSKKSELYFYFSFLEARVCSKVALLASFPCFPITNSLLIVIEPNSSIQTNIGGDGGAEPVKLSVAGIPTSKLLPQPVKPPESDERNRLVAEEEDRTDRRREHVAKVFRAIYEPHVNACAPLDPSTKEIPSYCADWFANSAIRIDTLDTLWTLGMKKEFYESRRWVETRFDPVQNVDVPVAEATTRLVGGLLSAFDLSNRPIFLNRAIQLADRLMSSLKMSKAQLPATYINLATGATKLEPNDPSKTLRLGNLVAMQLEFAFIGHHINTPKYAVKTLDVLRHIRKHPLEESISAYATDWDSESGMPKTSVFSLNSIYATRFYELTYKLHRLFYKRVRWVDDAWTEMATAVLKRLAVQSGTMVVFKEEDFEEENSKKGKGEKLRDDLGVKMSLEVCNLPGLFAFHAQDTNGGERGATSYLMLAEGLLRVCFDMHRQAGANGLATDFSLVRSGSVSAIPNYPDADKKNLDSNWRIFESLMYMAKLTGDPKYKNMAWELFEQISQLFELPLTSSIENVNKNIKEDTKQATRTHHRTYTTAEMRFLTKALKFLFLGFSDLEFMPLAKTVWNADGHPFVIFKPDPKMYI